MRLFWTILARKLYNRMRFCSVPARLAPQIMCSKYRWYMPKGNVHCAKFVPFCGHHVVTYTNNVFKRDAIVVVWRAYLTFPTRLHSIFESVLKRWISTSFDMISNQKCRWYMDANNLPCVNYITFRWLWHVLCRVGSITCYMLSELLSRRFWDVLIPVGSIACYMA